MEEKKCKDCDNFLGGGDWNLCCKNPPKSQVGWLGHLCYENDPACENFKDKVLNKDWVYKALLEALYKELHQYGPEDKFNKTFFFEALERSMEKTK